MLVRASIHRFVDASFGDKLVAIEASFQLLLARFNTLGSAEHFTSQMGELEGRPAIADAEQQAHAARIGYLVGQVARMMPFRCVCLQQVLAVRRMLKRRHIPSTVYLGVLPERFSGSDMQTDPLAKQLPGAIAHAWVKSGERVVNGETDDLGDYVVVGVFS